MLETDPTLPRYGTDLLQVLILTFEAKLREVFNYRDRTSAPRPTRRSTAQLQLPPEAHEGS